MIISYDQWNNQNNLIAFRNSRVIQIKLHNISNNICGARKFVTLAHFTLGPKTRAEERSCRGHTMKVQIALGHSRG